MCLLYCDHFILFRPISAIGPKMYAHISGVASLGPAKSTLLCVDLDGRLCSSFLPSPRYVINKMRLLGVLMANGAFPARMMLLSPNQPNLD